MEKDILIDGIITYTKEDKLKWEIYNEMGLSTDYKSSLMISKSKELSIRFYCNYTNMKQSGINISIQTESNRITTYTYMSSNDFQHGNRFKELSDLINKKMKKV